MEEKECKDQKKMEIRRRRSMPDQGSCLRIEWATLSRLAAVEGKGLAAVVRNSLEMRRKEKE